MSLALFFFAEGIRRVSVCFFQHALVAGAAFAAGVACAEGAAAVLGAGSAVDDGLPDVSVLTLPPHFPPAAGEDMVGGKGAVQGGVPLARYLGIEGGEVVIPGEHFGVGAVWAAAVPLGAAGDGGLVFMAFVADPPDFFVAGGGDVLWGEAAVFLWMPLAGYVWVLACEVVLAGDDFFACTDGAAAAVDAGADGGAPLVAFVADPPDFAPAAGQDVMRGEATILCWVPLAGEVWVMGGEVVIAGEDVAVGADGTACTADTGFDLGAPFVAIGAKPPHELVAAGENVGRGEGPVLCGVPLAGELGISGGEVCFAGDGAAACAIGAACAAAAAGVDGCLPVVAVGAGPPYAVLAAAGDGLWCEGQVACAVPLGEELFAVFAVTEIGQGFAHGDHSPFLRWTKSTFCAARANAIEALGIKKCAKVAHNKIAA